jgi:hypothetical protein
MWTSSTKRKIMKKAAPFLKILIFLLAIHTFNPTEAQETMYEVLDVMDLPPELNPKRKTSCSLEFQEQWILNVGKASISKVVNAYEISCKDSTDVPGLPEGAFRLKNLSYEFSFLDLMDAMDQKAIELQEAMIALIKDRYPIPELYDPRKQLLSVYFHEDWVLEADHQLIKKTVKAITPVIWQERRTAEGEALHDAETGYPVYYILKLERIDLRQP